MRRFELNKRIAVTYPGSVPWIARCLDGVRSYAQEHGGWRIYTSPPTLGSTGEWELSLRSLRDWNGDAIITVSSDEEELRFARELKIPVVNLGGGLSKPHGIPRIMVDHFQAGQMAAEHLLEHGLPQLAFFGWENLWYSQRRCEGFQQRAAEAGVKCQVWLSPSREAPDQSWGERISGPAGWLTSLRLPCGIFAVQDYRAQLLVEACDHTGLRVPEDIAIVGMDNNEIICQHSAPTITSVSRNSEEIGRKAAALLHRMMLGKTVRAVDSYIPPDGVVARQSTDILHHADVLVRNTIAHLNSHPAERFNIAMLADRSGVSKRTFELRFRRSTGKTPHDYILRQRVKQAEALMRETEKRTLQQIASECGFGTYPTFCAAFRRFTGQTPRDFRASLGRE